MGKVSICRNGVDIELTPEEIEKIYRIKALDYKTQDVQNKIAERDDCSELTDLDVSIITNQFDSNLSKNDSYFEAYWASCDFTIDDYLRDNYENTENSN